MAHVLIIGTTESGKTTLAKRLCSVYRERGVASLVFDPVGDSWPDAALVTEDPNVFLDVARRSTRCMLFVDESREAVGHWDRERFWLATRSRHLGHTAHFLAQRATDVAPSVRNQTGRLFVFRCALPDAKILALEWSQPELVQAAELPKGAYLACGRFDVGVRKGELFQAPTAPLASP